MSPEGFALSEAPPDANKSQTSPSSDAPPTDTKKTENGDGEGNKPTGNKVSRKRTKTGCLTCRKRRIKCGEERPTCNNCIKSKRVCEGYNQRVVFKDGMHGLFPPRALATNQRYPQPYPALQPAPSGPQPLQPIAPAPPVFRDEPITPLDRSLAPHLQEIYAERARNPPQYHGPGINVTVPLPSPRSEENGYPFFRAPNYIQTSSSPQQQQGDEQFYQQTPVEAAFAMGPTPPQSEPSSSSVFGGGGGSGGPPFSASQAFSSPTSSSERVYPSPLSTTNNRPAIDSKYAAASSTNVREPAQEYNNNGFDGREDLPESSSGGVGLGLSNPSQPAEYTDQPFGPDEFTMLPQDADIDYDFESEDDMDEDEDDREYKIGAQEDGMIMMDTSIGGGRTMGTRQQISQVLEPFARHLDEHSRISFRCFLPEPGTLATYHPTLSSSPLMNPTTANIFCHFVYVLGPSMSLFERYPPNPHITFTPGAGLHGPQNVWSYTIPMMSLSHPPLLHALLALSSLHISKLTNGPDHPSLLHYHIALRRLGKAIASDRHRGHVATLAATLMLAYYETMAAEHDKWSSHVHGAKQLLKEIDFDRVTKRVEMLGDDEEAQAEVDSQEAAAAAAAAAARPAGATLLAARRMRRQMIADDSDFSLKSYFMGKRGSANKQKGSRADRPFSKKELEHLKLQADMFWWYVKMDCYQSILSGCPLVLDYVHWDQCPPRSRIGTLGTSFGSSDHYFLLLGRLCDFQVRDVKRKIAIFKRNGGRWVPPPEMGGPPRGFRPPPPPPGHGPPPAQEPIQFGMIPPSTRPQRIPRAFAEQTPPQEQTFANQGVPEPLPDTADLDAATLEAEREWTEIQQAFLVYKESLGVEYQPLGIDYMPAAPTPFGPAIYYRTYSIAALQMLLNLAMLVLHRCHPDMPPMPMMATTIQQRKTSQIAMDVARIVAGLVPTDSSSQINPALGASLIESTVPLFFAGVQYDQDDQRDWLVHKLREINRLTGWATSSRVMLGCQRAWVSMAENGAGPPYTRPPFEEQESQMFCQYYSSDALAARSQETEMEAGGGESGRFLWRAVGQRVLSATGILGDRNGGGEF